MFAYFNNGTSFRAVDSAYVAETGEILFPTYATPTQLTAAFPGYAAAAAPTLAQQAATAAVSGLTITCTLTPSASATYDSSEAGQSLFTKMFNLIQRAGGSAFPFGETSILWPAMVNGQPAAITFTSPQTFLAIEDAVSKFVFTLDQIALTNSGTLPNPSITLDI